MAKLNGEIARENRSHNARVMLAWRIAHLSRLKRPDRVAKKWLVKMPEQRRPPQTWQQMKDVAARWTAALGGKIVNKNPE